MGGNVPPGGGLSDLSGRGRGGGAQRPEKRGEEAAFPPDGLIDKRPVGVSGLGLGRRRVERGLGGEGDALLGPRGAAELLRGVTHPDRPRRG